MSSVDDHGPTPVLAAFLSHRYESPEVNLYFQRLTAAVATIGFRVDSGRIPWHAPVGETQRRPTSTTRLERMIRDAHVFVGVWPLPGDPTASWQRRADLEETARYFRLELDMAARAHKPGIVFTDGRYRDILEPPAGIAQVHFDAQDLRFGDAAPGWREHGAAFAAFGAECDKVITRPLRKPVQVGRVGVLVGDHPDVEPAGVIDELLTGRVLRPVRLPRSMGPAFLRQVRRCDWVVADLSDPAVEVLATFLHGQAVPLLRLRRAPGTSDIDDVLFGDLRVGYRKDVVAWNTEEELRTLLGERLDVILEEPVYLGDRATAERYFISAAQRDEPVFLSYAGEDAVMGAEVSARLSRRFRDVFDYRDRQRRGLPLGEPWMDNLYRKLSVSEIGVILHSAHYRDSPYCPDEQRHLYDRHLTGKLKLLVIRLDDTPVPENLTMLQNANIRYADPARIVDDFVDGLGPPPARRPVEGA